MRNHLFDPTQGDARLGDAIALAREIYALFESGSDYSTSLRRLELIAEHPIDGFAVDSAFGSVSPESFARTQLIAWDKIPSDVTREEMSEMIGNICTANGDDWQVDYWIECLRVNTGDDNVSGLIFWPGIYFGDGNNQRIMTTAEILTIALRAGGKSWES